MPENKAMNVLDFRVRRFHGRILRQYSMKRMAGTGLAAHYYSNIAVLKLEMMKHRDWHNVFPDITG